jgi:hypothetical protein
LFLLWCQVWRLFLKHFFGCHLNNFQFFIEGDTFIQRSTYAQDKHEVINIFSISYSFNCLKNMNGWKLKAFNFIQVPLQYVCLIDNKKEGSNSVDCGCFCFPI